MEVESLDSNLHQPGRGDELLFLGMSRNMDRAGRRTHWYE